MSIGASLTLDTARALLSAINPLTGKRSVGQLRLKAKPGKTLALPPNLFWTPVVGGSRNETWLFKTTEGPNPDKSWTVDDSGTSLITLISNIGGIRHNLPKDTPFVNDIPLDDLVTTGVDAPKAEDDFAQGADPPDYCGIQDAVIYETLDGPALHTDLKRSKLTKFPGVLVAFQDLTPADGVSISQVNQSAVNAGDGKKFYKATYTINVITSRTQSDNDRRKYGLIIADAIMQILNDKHSADQGECLSNPGGVQIRQMIREDGPQDIYKKFYIYTILVSCMVLLQRVDFRTYSPWLRAVMNVDKPQLPALPNQGDFRLVEDVEIDMTPDTLDLAIDGTFTRASSAYLDGSLLEFAVDERRVTNPALGVFMEPAVTNDLGASAEDLTTWTAESGASVTADDEDDPLGNPVADRANFDSDADSALALAGLTAGTDPVMLSVYAKSPGLASKTKFRLAAEDASAVKHVSEDFVVGPNWERFTFLVYPSSAGALTMRLQNASDGQARNVLLWGALYSNGSRWGAQYPGTGTKAIDNLVFDKRPPPQTTSNLLTPLDCLTGKWQLRYTTPDDVPPSILGTGDGVTERVLCSLGDGVAADLMQLKLIGTPGSGGAALTMTTRGDGVVLSLAGVEWIPGSTLSFTIDATGNLVIEGTTTHDGPHSFDRYDGDADVAEDFLVIGNVTDFSSSPAPGSYVAVEVNV